MRVTKTIFRFILGLLLLLTYASCSINVMTPAMLSYKETVFKDKGIKVTGISSGIKSQKSAIKEATENALKKAGPDYDILSDVEIKTKIGFLSTKHIVTGTAHKSGDITK